MGTRLLEQRGHVLMAMDEVTEDTVESRVSETRIYLNELEPGDVLISEVDSAQYVFIGAMDHPIYEGLRLVMWWKWEKGYVLDALAPDQEVAMKRHFRYRQASDKKQLLSLAILTWQQSGASLHP